MDRPDFTRNPTNCDPLAVNARILSDLGALATPSDRFQMVECAALGFHPHIGLRLKGGHNRNGHPAATIVVRPAPATPTSPRCRP